MQRILAILLVICLVFSFSTAATATSEKQYDYSTTANSGVRHETCTTLLGTSASSYYTDENTYDALSELSGDELLTQLRQLMTSTHTKKSTYNNCRDKAVQTDCENGDGITVSLIYTSYSATREDWCNNRSNGWNREHVWPKAQGDFEQTETPGCDMHHVRPSDQPINSTRGNKIYGNVDGGTAAKSATYVNTIGGYYKGNYFEPLDNVKGDVARICLYVYVRYGSEYPKCGSITNVFQSVDVLLEWCALDPVDTWEMGRNEVVAAFQGNRNVFIDYPELAWLLFDQQIPNDMVTPSGEASNSTPAACFHSSTIVKNTSAATCTKDGYTGDTCCVDCGKLLKSGETIPATGHINQNGDDTCDACGASVTCGHGETKLQDALDATCGASGYTGDTCCIHCGKLVKSGAVIPATGQHTFGSWTVTQEATTEAPGIQERTCCVCNQKETAEIPQLEKPAEPDTEPTEPDTEPTEPDTEPTEPDTEPTEPDTEPTEPDTESTEPSVGSSEPNSKPSTEPTEPEKQLSTDNDRTWLVYMVIGIGAVVCVVVIILQNKRSK